MAKIRAAYRAWSPKGAREKVSVDVLGNPGGSVSLSPGVCFCHRPSYLVTIVYIVNANILHTFWIFHIWHGVYMCSLCVFSIM